MHHVTRLLETNFYVRCLLIDFSKAFDVVDHGILAAKLTALNPFTTDPVKPERQSARMSEINNSGLDQYGAEAFE